MKKVIEIWFTDYKDDRVLVENNVIKTLSHAVKVCKVLEAEGLTGFCIDVTYYDNDEDLIENKSKWYSFRDNKLRQI